MKTLPNILNDFIIKVLREQSFYAERAEVTGVDTEAMTCTVITKSKQTILYNVIIGAYRAATFGAYLIPKVNSVVTIAYYSRNEAYIVKPGPLERIQLDMGTGDGEGVTLVVEDGVITLNGGELGGLIAIEDLTTKLNDLVGELDALKDLYNAHVHITTATVGASATPGILQATTSTGQPATKFDRADYENEEINHGRVGE